MLNSIILIIASYLIGSFPSGLVIGKLFYKTDIREHGSGNLGGTNAIRVLGKKGGGSVMVLDILKGGIATLLAMHFGSELHPLIIAIFSVVGHIYPIFAGFRGGKAVATAGGIILFFSPVLFITLFIIFVITLATTKIMSIASSTIATFAFIIIWTNPYANPNYDQIARIMFTILPAIVIIKHIPNYKRILNGTEPKITNKKD